LLKNGCKLIYFKYCSTFDSSPRGNIGPVADMLMQELGTDFTIFQPALPINGRAVFKGYLFVGDVLLSDSGMRNHPITPMTDSYLPRLVEMQSKGKCGVIDVYTVRKGVQAVLDKVAELKSKGYSYAVLDAITEDDLLIEGEAFKDMPLVTGGSGLPIGLARAVREEGSDAETAMRLGYPQGKKAVVLSGSCSIMTNAQVGYYAKLAATLPVNVALLMGGDEAALAAYMDEMTAFLKEHLDDEYAPLVYATADTTTLAAIQNKYGVEASSSMVEKFFATLAVRARELGVQRFIIAGGETSSIVTKALEVAGFYIGKPIAPGVPWVRSINSPLSLTLKSGNFGQEDFFVRAQKEFPVEG
ncbi:MAG: four-carbon acid sugar kinase family protein, partial [Desulfovibrionaceae bacterium]|nr:four-carbon acid sugar kinase family protein [Desulfovibrionaceae bacterium]